MFTDNPNNSNKNTSKPIAGKLITIYSDKTTKRIAKILSEKISKKSKNLETAIWSLKHYEDTSPSLTSANKIVAFGISLKDEFASDPTIKDVYYKYGTHIRIDGNSCLIYADNISIKDYNLMQAELNTKAENKPNSDNNIFSNLNKEDIMVAAGLIAVPYYGFLGGLFLVIKNYILKKKSEKVMQYVFAIDQFLNSHLNDFLENEKSV